VLNKKNVLIIAYACEPNKTSEPGVGWNLSKEISKFSNTTILTRENNKVNIETIKDTSDKRIFIYYDLPNFFKILKKKMPLGTQLYYLCWQWGAYRYASKQSIKIDIVHHLTFGTSWISPPSFMLKKKFIWGPIGGGDFIPSSFLKQMNMKSILQESLYYSLNKLSRLSPFSYFIKKTASAIIFRTTSAKEVYSNSKSKILPIISETATNDLEEQGIKVHTNYIHALCIGRMTYWKGFIHAVRGFHDFLNNGGKGKLELLGNGPELERISQYVKSNNLEEHILMHGFVDATTVKEKLNKANILLHPSFRDGGSWSIMEAMSYGLPVICLNTSGPKDMVTEKCGLLIDMLTPSQVDKDIGNGLLHLSADLKQFEMLSKNAQNRIKTQYNWTIRGKEIKRVYERVINNNEGS
jgi:glycosyltransferase involved in cell wall biosynthesis